MATRNQQPLDADRIKFLKQKRRAKKKVRKQQQRHQQQSLAAVVDNANTTSTKGSSHESTSDNDENKVYCPDNAVHATLQHASKEWQELIPVLQHFTWTAQPQSAPPKDRDSTTVVATPQPPAVPDQQQQQQQKPSRKKLKRLTQLTFDELKQIADVPEVVEPWDVTAADPGLLIGLKGYRNTVPVPRHWHQKQAYLHHRKDRPAWQLPDYIAQTGIADTRDAMRQREARASARRRARLNPKLGRMDIDYQKLHDAFFRHPIRVRLSRHGELYYEGKEWNNHYRPGVLSDTLRTALGMDKNKDGPPPWLYSMQRHGPPPGHSNLRLPGINAPVPKNAPLGYKHGGWGAPPPLVSVVHGSKDKDNELINKQRWGELLDEENELDRKEQSSDQDDDDDEAEEKEEGEDSPKEDEPVTEFDVPDTLELRKGRPTTTTGSSQHATFTPKPPLYHVLAPSAKNTMSGFMASQHTYTLPATKDVDVAVHDPSELDDTGLLRSRYEDGQDSKPSSEQQQRTREDVSDMYLKHAQLQAKRRKQQERLKQSKKKDFRF